MYIEEHEYNQVIDGLKMQLILHNKKQQELIAKLKESREVNTGLLNTIELVRHELDLQRKYNSELLSKEKGKKKEGK